MPTPIEWCDETFNPWWGCERVSPACAHCYADTFAIRLGMKTLWPKGGNKITDAAPHAFRFFGDKHWDEPLKWARTLPAKLGRRPRIFCASMADVFEERDELEEHRVRLFSLIASTPELDWLVLTKRPESARDWLPDGGGFVFPNVWIGTSIENARYTWRADVLREIPAAVRFISAEPLLGSLYEGKTDTELQSVPVRDKIRDEVHARRRKPLDLSGIDWVIIGGESGPKARSFHLEHAREIIRAALDECADCRALAGEYVGRLQWKPEFIDDHTHWAVCGRTTAVFVKQLGAKPVIWPVGLGAAPPPEPLKLHDRKGGDMDEWPADLRIREFPRTAVLA